MREFCEDVVTVAAPAVPGSLKSLLYTSLSFVSKLPAIARMCHSNEMIAALRQLTSRKKFELIHVEFTQAAHYVDHFGSIPCVIDESDIAHIRRQRFTDTVSSPVKRTLLQWDTQKLKNYELSFCSKYSGILVRTECDKHTMERAIPGTPIDVIPTWVDLSFAQDMAPDESRNTLLFYGAMWRPVNDQAALFFLDDVFPAIRAQIAGCRFIALGSRPSRELIARACEDVVVPGFVADVAPHYRESSVVVAPLRAGAGIKVKVIQGLACGKPVVTTSIGAEGIPATEKDGLFVRDTPESFAECVVWLLKEKRYLGYYEATRRFVSEHYDCSSRLDRLNRFYQRLTARTGNKHGLERTEKREMPQAVR